MTIEIAGVRFEIADVEDARQSLLGENRDGRHVHFANAYTLSLTRNNARLLQILNEGVCFADGRSVSLVGRIMSGRKFYQAPGPDVFEATLNSGAGARHFLLGGAPETLQRLEERIDQTWPAARVVGSYSPPFRYPTSEELDTIAHMVAHSGADICWVGLGTPKQDIVACELAARVGVTFACVGAAFDFSAGNIRRAPKWVRAGGLEWLFRLVLEPKRLWRRYLLGNPVFLYLVIKRWIVQ